jgi:hypothetical protein
MEIIIMSAFYRGNNLIKKVLLWSESDPYIENAKNSNTGTELPSPESAGERH